MADDNEPGAVERAFNWLGKKSTQAGGAIGEAFEQRGGAALSGTLRGSMPSGVVGGVGRSLVPSGGQIARGAHSAVQGADPSVMTAAEEIALEKDLLRVGLNPGNVNDGKGDRATLAAMEKFRTDHHLSSRPGVDMRTGEVSHDATFEQVLHATPTATPASPVQGGKSRFQ